MSARIDYLQDQLLDAENDALRLERERDKFEEDADILLSENLELREKIAELEASLKWHRSEHERLMG